MCLSYPVQLSSAHNDQEFPVTTHQKGKAGAIIKAAFNIFSKTWKQNM